jgi:hypothetical protein
MGSMTTPVRRLSTGRIGLSQQGLLKTMKTLGFQVTNEDIFGPFNHGVQRDMFQFLTCGIQHRHLGEHSDFFISKAERRVGEWLDWICGIFFLHYMSDGHHSFSI